MDSRLFKNCKNAEEVEKLKSFLQEHKIVLDFLNEIVYNIRVGIEKVNITDYDSPSWSHKQAHNNGKVDALRQVENLLSLDQQANP